MNNIFPQIIKLLDDRNDELEKIIFKGTHSSQEDAYSRQREINLIRKEITKIFLKEN